VAGAITSGISDVRSASVGGAASFEHMTLPWKLAEIPFGSGSVVSAVTLADFEPGGGGA